MDAPWTIDQALDYASGLLRGERVSLRESTEDDFAVLARWWAEPAVSVLQTNFVRPTPATTVSDMMRGWNTNVGNDAGFTIVLNPEGSEGGQPGTVIGQVGLFGIGKNRTATLGIIVGTEYWGQGLGTEALRLAVGYGFVEMGLHRIQLGVYGYNDRAIRAYSKVGFREEGRQREAVYHDRRWHDELLMGILEHEWHS
ncbi:MAG TPA: GNAT family protein [Nocardioidaceae bacterium]|jgi:RimJ/RimL family protein N-acetyltransferase